MPSPSARPDLLAYNESVHLSTVELVSRLREALGAKLVAYLASLQETRTVGEWASGEAVPTDGVAARLRVAYRVASLLLEKDGAAVVQVWFQGANRHLGDRAPARLLRDADVDDFESALLAAAREFTT